MTFRAVCRACLLLPALAGCRIATGHFVVVATQPSASLAAARGDAAPLVHGRSCVWVLGVVPVTPLPDLGAALEEAAAAGHTDVLTDVVVEYELIYVPILAGRGCYVVRGRAS